ncbi:MAG: V-type ATPase 116kDa subunit family protein [Erysipelotrichaceae bacterium]
MAIAKMRLVNILSDLTHLNDVLLRFIEMDNIHPIEASRIADRVGGLTTLTQENPYVEVLNRFKEVTSQMEMNVTLKEVKDQEYDLAKCKNYLEDTYSKFINIKNVKDELTRIIQESQDALIQLTNVEALDVDFDDLFSCRYIKVRFGRLPIDSVNKLKYYENHPFVFKSFSQDKAYSWCMYITTNRYEGEVDNVFSSLYFERIRIPDFVHGTPEKAKELLGEEIKNDQAQLIHVEEKLAELRANCQNDFETMYGELIFLNTTFEARRYVLCLGERFSITGFVAKSDIESVKKLFADLEGVEIEDRPADSDKRLTPPTKLKNGWFARPFSMFVEMYGMPGYRDIDPTSFVALTYTILFGIMFGDLGQGLLLILVGFIAYKWKHMKLGEVGIRIGISSAFFGIVYGSVFGNETILNPLYKTVFGLSEKPIEVLSSEAIMPLLIIAIAIGAILIICSMLINLRLQIKHKNIGELLFSQNGVSGLVFYVALIGGAALQLGAGIQLFTPVYVILLILLPLFLIFMKEPLEAKLEHKKMFPDGVGAFCMQSFFELFEVCLSYITNTISYLRVGGFVLSHAGMMLVVVLLADMMGTFGSMVVLVCGNIFVMCLEGMIVGIQVLRLEFYEMFSRYFEGNGIEFISLKSSI